MPMTEQRVAVYFDIENLFHPFRQVRRWDAGVALVARILDDLKVTGIVVSAMGVCDREAWRQVAFPLSELGVRVFTHRGGVDAADAALAEQIRTGLSPSAGTVVIASGDHYFAELASELSAGGRHVIAVALSQCMSHELYRAADAARLLPVPAAIAA
jgi:NYN domain